MKIVSIYLDEKDWDEFLKKHKSASARIRKLIKMDLEDKLPKEED